ANFLNKTNSDKVSWQANTVLRILRNPALYGATRWNEEIYENTHEGIITKSNFIKLQRMLDDRSRYRRKEVKSTYLFQGIIACPNCDKILTVNRYFRKRKDGSEHQFALYRCQMCEKEGSYNKNISEAKIMDALYDYMDDYNADEENEEKEKTEPQFLKQLRDIEKKREKFQRAWASDLMTDDEFKKTMEETRSIYEDLKRKADEYKEPSAIDTNYLNDVVHAFKRNFTKLTTEEQKSFISTSIRKIELEIINIPPKRLDRSKKGRYDVRVRNVDFY